VAASNVLVNWTQKGHNGDQQGMITFMSDSGLYSITLELEKQDGLYYCPTDVFTVAKDPICPNILMIHRIVAPHHSLVLRSYKRYILVTCDCLMESEVWMLRLGSPTRGRSN
jgi:hypothetical protein